MRWPFENYHSNFDNIQSTDISKIEEVIDFTLSIIYILENDEKIIVTQPDVPCLSNPDLNLYLAPKFMSNIITNDQLNNIDLDHSIFNKFQSYLEQNTDLLYPFMNNVLRMADGQKLDI